MTKKEREKIHEIARNLLRARNRDEIVRIAREHEKLERELVGEIMNTEPEEWYSDIADSAMIIHNARKRKSISK